MVPFHLNRANQSRESVKQSVRAPGLPRPVDSADTKIPFHRVAIDHASEGEYISRFGAKYNVTYVDRAFYPSRLVRTLEMACEGGAILYQIDIFRGGVSVIAFGLNFPLARDIRRWPLLW